MKVRSDRLLCHVTNLLIFAVRQNAELCNIAELRTARAAHVQWGKDNGSVCRLQDNLVPGYPCAMTP